MRRLLFLGVLLIGACGHLLAQSTNASLTGYITDPAKAIIVGAKVIAINVDTNIRYQGITNNAGDYDVTNLPPGKYRIEVEKPGFKTVVKSDVILHVQDTIAINFEMVLGSVSEIVTVEGGAPVINTTDASVSTVVDREFAENLPLNGRSFQTLIELTPGVVLTPSNSNDGGQFSVDGQRAASNYWTVDGVSANIGIGSTYFSQGNGVSGALPSFSTLGGTNSLVSVDALQEFRIQTSTYAPEFGRSPGAQISIVTRSGTNQFHGTLFDYLRNDVLDANNWFADRDHLRKPQERQNDFGGTFSGPIRKDNTFFFFSYEGLRLRLPQVTESPVPDMLARQNAVAAVLPYFNAFPKPTPGSPDDTSTGIAEFRGSYSNRASLDAYSLRIDHKVGSKLGLFGRYNYSPSSLVQRGVNGGGLSSVVPSDINTQTATVGATWSISPTTVSDIRLNYSRTSGESSAYLDNFGGAVPLTSLPFPAPFSQKNGLLAWLAGSLPGLLEGTEGRNLQRQINLVGNISLQRGSHNFKFGADFRRLTPIYEAPAYYQQPLFLDVPSAEANNLFLSFIDADREGSLLLRNLGMFAQDDWRATPRLTITYGVRWDIDFSPSSNPPLSSVTGFNLGDPSSLALAPAGTAAFRTAYGNFAPRVGAAYQILAGQRWASVLRGGVGLFYDLATSEVGNTLFLGSYPFGAVTTIVGGSFPLNPRDAAPPPITAASLSSGTLYAFDPNLKLPYTLEWNLAIEQALGSHQALSGSYVGSRGRRLLETAFVNSPTPDLGSVQVVANAAQSDYDALQVQFHRQLSKGLQALASYVWSHSIDTASAGSLYGNTANALLPDSINSNRASSDFDIRHSFSTGVTYALPSWKNGPGSLARVLAGWSVQTVLQARSAVPVNLFDGQFFFLKDHYAEVRPDVVSGQPFYLFGPQYPGGKAFNPAAFASPPTDANGNPLRQGDLSRNALRAFGAAQWDFAVHRDFAIRDTASLEFRAELFNVLNHPNFGPPVADTNNVAQFGQSNQILAGYLGGGNLGSGGFSALYQLGGPRSIQFALKLRY
ncbi:MAG TPA: TonB-dependent receptor [Candidatus Acidoferrum sp.]|nr:TonB-dependent receptor [Candidatus Acidoferrum sp.]